MEKETDEIYSGLLNELKNYLAKNYEPVADPAKADFHLSTLEIYNQLQRLLPVEKFKPADVATWLHSAGFKFWDYGYMQFEWMLKTKISLN